MILPHGYIYGIFRPSFPRSMDFIFRCHHHFLQRRVPSVARLPLQMLKRQIKITPSERKAQPFTPRHRWDRVPPEFRLIYESSIKNYVAAFRISIGVTAVFSALVIASELPKKWEQLSEGDLTIPGVLGCFLLLAVIGTSMLARQFFFRIYHLPSSNQFIAVRRSWLGRLQQLKYTSDDIVFKHKPGTEVQDGTSVRIKGRKCHLTASDFITPSYYNMHLGEREQNFVRKSYVGGPKF